MKASKHDFREHYRLEHYRDFLERYRKRGSRRTDPPGREFELAVWAWLLQRSAEGSLQRVPGAGGRAHPWAEAWERLVAGAGVDPGSSTQDSPSDREIVTAGMADCLIDPVVKHREEADLPIEERYERLVRRVAEGQLPHDRPLDYGRSVDPLTGERLRVDIAAWWPRLGAVRRVNGRYVFVHVA